MSALCIKLWEEEKLENIEVLEQRTTVGTSNQELSFQPGTRSQSTTEQKSIKVVLLASDFMNLPPTNRRNSLPGYYITPTSAYGVTCMGGYIDPMLSPKADIAGVELRSEDDQYLQPWEDFDLLRLGLGMTESVEPAQPSEEEGLLAGIGGRGRS